MIELSDVTDRLKKTVEGKYESFVVEEMKKITDDEMYMELVRECDEGLRIACRDAKFRLESQGEDK